MTTLELNNRKLRLIQGILNQIDTDAALEQLEILYRRLTQSAKPCAYTLDEVKARLTRAEEDDKAGRFVVDSELDKLIARWK